MTDLTALRGTALRGTALRGSTPLLGSPAGMRERRDPESPLRRLDWLLLGAVAALLVLGSLLVWSATRDRQIAAGLPANAFLQRHLLNIVVGLGVGAAAAVVDYRSLRAYAPVVYALSTLGLLAVLSPLGSTINGAHSWIVLGGGFSVQPSEFAKVALVVLGAMLLADRDGQERPGDGDVLLVLGLAAVPMALVMLQPDLGTVIVLCFVLLGVLGVAGARGWLLGLLLAAGVAVVAAAVALGVLDDYQINRLAAFANPGLDPQGVGYNINQARIAVGSGGMLGKGLFEGTQTTGRFVPEQQTDFVFTVAGEELGFVGAGLVIALLGVVLWRGLRAAAQSRDAFGTVIAGGVVCWFGFQSFVNIGMTLGILPVMGLPLPFVSYGGSSMFATCIGLGLLLNVGMRSSGRER